MKMRANQIGPEQWRPVPIPRFAKHYEVSNRGRVRRRSEGWMTFPGRILRGTRDAEGYKIVKLSTPYDRHFRLHRLVALAFVANPNRRRLKDVNHLSGIKTDCCAPNLSWTNAVENIKHAFATGLIKRASRLTLEQIERIMLSKGQRGSGTRLARKFKISRGHLSNIGAGRVLWRVTAGM